jgi:hypothetical protein
MGRMGGVQCLAGKAVAVSLEGVVVAHPAERLEVVASNLNLPHQRLREVWDDLLGDALMDGKVIESEAWRYLGRLTFTSPAFVREAFLNAMFPNHYGIKATDALRGYGVRLVLVASYRSWVHTLQSRYPWLQSIHETSATSDYRVGREHARYLDALAQRFGSNDFLFVDANPQVVDAVRAHGTGATLAKGLWLDDVVRTLEGEAPRRPLRAA